VDTRWSNSQYQIFCPLPHRHGLSLRRLPVSDDNRYIDYNLCYGALILGHGDQRIIAAINETFSQIGTAIFGTPHRLETEMARVLVDLYPGIEKLRFTNSGLEATLLAIRLAMAWTGRKKLAKFEGHYHGSHDQVLISVPPKNERLSSFRQKQ
jgi:glutamate-1-semialdehyde 2,1-aminomutase